MSSTRPPLNVIAEVLDFDELTAVRTSAEGILAKVESGTRGGDVFNFAETVWPAAVGSGPFTPELLLIPLSRLGAVQGFSGNRVMIGYFVDRDMAILPSRPMVVKISAKGDAEKLLDERNRANAVRLHLAYYPGEFALPLQCETIGDYAVLWSPFSSSTPLLRTFRRHAASRLALGIEDLWFHLRSSPSRPASNLSAAFSGQKVVTAEDTLLDPVKDPPSVRGKEPDLVDAIEHIYEILKSLHLRSGRARREKRSLIVEYRRYLRGVSDWGAAWHSIWAPPEEKSIRIGTEQHLNPLWVLGRIETIEEQNLFCGAVHGDLHPRNILFSSQKAPHVIDFGWAADGAHIAKDFALLECNVRFMVMRPEITPSELHDLGRWIGFDGAAPLFANAYCQSRVDLVKCIRGRARNVFPEDTDWDVEYIIPLFLIALGLLKHLRDTDNQAAATSFVLSLANYLGQAEALRSS